MRKIITISTILGICLLANLNMLLAQTNTQDPPQGVVNINTATQQQLMLIPGIGIKKAQAIIESRQQRPFQRVEQITRVKGIGQGIFRRIRPFIVVEGDTTLTVPLKTGSRHE